MQTLLQKLGLDPKESRTCLKLLELGAQPVSVLAKNVGIPRPTMYLVLESLKKKGFIEDFERMGIKYVRAIPAKNFPDILRRRESEIATTRELLETHFPELEKLENHLSITPKVRFFEGAREVEKMYDEVCQQSEFCAFFDPYLVKKFMPRHYFRIPEELKRRGGTARELLVDGDDAREYRDRFHSKKHQIHLLPAQIQFPSDTIITKTKIFMIAYGEAEIVATEIQSPSLAKTQKVWFDELWQKFQLPFIELDCV